MTPKEEAIKLVYDFWEVEPLSCFDGDSGYYSKQCAIIAVEKILDVLYNIGIVGELEESHDHYLQVREEIIMFDTRNYHERLESESNQEDDISDDDNYTIPSGISIPYEDNHL